MRWMRRTLYMIAILSVLAVLCFTSCWFRRPQAQERTLNAFSNTHMIGGFSIDTPDRANQAATDGVQVVFDYGQPPSESSALGQKLQSLHMRVVDGYIASYLHYYECHRTNTVTPPYGWSQYCQQDYYPFLTDEDALLKAIATHLQEVKNNRLVIGYWVLDDWLMGDAGSARQLLSTIHTLIQQYTPGRPAICGFGGSIEVGSSYEWSDWLADNFSPQGCDMVGLYMYTPVLLDTAPAPFPNTYNWSMSGLLPEVFASLKRRGWDITKEPLIGIAQAFGGPRNHTNFYSITPTAKNIETQSRSFCQHGASDLVFYGWDDSGFGPSAQTPMTNTGIEIGIRNGVTACKHYWS